MIICSPVIPSADREISMVKELDVKTFGEQNEKFSTLKAFSFTLASRLGVVVVT